MLPVAFKMVACGFFPLHIDRTDRFTFFVYLPNLDIVIKLNEKEIGQTDSHYTLLNFLKVFNKKQSSLHMISLKSQLFSYLS